MYHSFAIRKNGSVYAWGSNNFGQTAIFTGAGASNADVIYPTEVRGLRGYKIDSILDGKDHSMAVTDQGRVLVWGRTDNKALGLSIRDIPVGYHLR